MVALGGSTDAGKNETVPEMVEKLGLVGGLYLLKWVFFFFIIISIQIY